MTNKKNNYRDLSLFILITCALSWAMAGVLYFADLKIPSISYTIAAGIYMLIPAAVAILLQLSKKKESIKIPFLISFKINRWFFVALFTPVVLVALSLGASLLVPDVSFSVSGNGLLDRLDSSLSAEQAEMLKEKLQSLSQVTFILLTVAQGLIAGCTLNALFAFGEELGWRGYMLQSVKHWSFIKVSLFTGFVWGAWHFPLILKGHNYPNHPVAGVFMMIAFCMLLSPLMTYMVVKSRSVLSAAIFHGTMNAFAGFPILYLAGGNDLSNGLTGYAGFAAIALTTLGFFLFDKYVSKENIFSSKINDKLRLP